MDNSSLYGVWALFFQSMMDLIETSWGELNDKSEDECEPDFKCFFASNIENKDANGGQHFDGINLDFEGFFPSESEDWFFQQCYIA